MWDALTQFTLGREPALDVLGARDLRARVVMLVFGFNTLGYLVYTNKRRDAPSWFGVDKVGRLCLDLRF